MGASPQFVDMDGAGILDLVSGSYVSPRSGNMLEGIRRLLGGKARRDCVYWFRGLGRGTFAAGQPVRDRDGDPVTDTHPGAEDITRPFATEPFFADWDGDGDIDLLVGNWEGEVILVRNEGFVASMALSAEGIRLKHGGRPIRVPGGLSGPEVADWDGDGRPDLLSGSGSGVVHFFRNEGTRKEPRYAEGVPIIPRGRYRDFLFADEEPVPGLMSRIHVVDHDGDGKLDILLGDMQVVARFRANLTADERPAALDLRRRWRVACDEVRGMELSGCASPQELKVSRARLEAMEQALRRYADEEIRHGHVWFFRRRWPEECEGCRASCFTTRAFR
jgi:VCBS repeat protein